MPEWESIVCERLAGARIEGARESEIHDELVQYLQDCYDDLLSDGFTEIEAQGIAVERLGQSETLIQELHRSWQPATIEPPVRGGFIASVIYDSKLALRAIRQRPGFSLMVIGMLTLGIAGNAAIFSIVNGLFLKPLPFSHSERLVDLNETAPQWNLHYVGVSVHDAYIWNHENKSFEGMAFFQRRNFNLSSGGAAQRVRGVNVTRDLMNVLGLKPVLGRNFTTQEDKPGGGNVVLLGYDLWRLVFQGDRQVLGRVIRLSDQPFTVVGVLPREALFPSDVDLWVPLAADPNRHDGWYLGGVGRLRPGVSRQQALADLLRIHKSQVASFTANTITSPTVAALCDRYLGDFKTVSKVLWAGVTVVLVIACVNIAALMMVRASSRAHEIAVRFAIGAVRARIIRQLLTENLVLATIGGIAGVLLGRLAVNGLMSMLPDVTPRWISFDLDLRFAIFCVLLIGCATLLFGLLPALRAAGVDPREGLHESAGRSSLARGTQRLLGGMVVFEVALALTLLVGAALLAHSFSNVLHADPGFRAENVLTFSVNLPRATYDDAKILVFHRTLLDELRKVPGVQAAGAASDAPLGGHSVHLFEAEGDLVHSLNKNSPGVLQVTATPGYFDAVGMTLLAGRKFNQHDGESKEAPVAIVNETFTKLHWPGKSPLGRRIRRDPASPWIQVVGEMRDERHYGLDQEVKPGVFIPEPQNPVSTMTIVLRAFSDPDTLIGPARDILRHINPDLPMFEVSTMTDQVARSLWARRTYSWLFGAFAVVALALAAAGVYGVISYAVTQRTREIGIRMTLGAQPAHVLIQVLSDGMRLVATGALLGIAGALTSAHLLQTLLFGVNPKDPFTYVVVLMGLSFVGIIANVIPARRAASVDPMKALRTE
jgi:predicted permease